MCSRRALHTGPLVVLLFACGRGPTPVLIELPTGTAEDVASRRAKGEWALEGPNESLRFFVGDLARNPSTAWLADSVPLASGDLLAVIDLSQEWEGQTCYLQLEQAGSGWSPKAVGLYLTSDAGFAWGEGLHGRVLVDSGDPGIIDCRVELVTTGGSVESFRLDFVVDPTKDTASLRRTISEWPGSPPLQ